MNTQDITKSMDAWKKGEVITDKELQTCVDAMKQTILVISYCDAEDGMVIRYFEARLRNMEEMQHLRIVHSTNR